MYRVWDIAANANFDQSPYPKKDCVKALEEMAKFLLENCTNLNEIEKDALQEYLE